MLSFVVIGTLAAAGLACLVWLMCGWMLPKEGGVLIYAGSDKITAARRYLWLKEMGFAVSPLWILDPEGAEGQWLQSRDIEVYSREEAFARLEMGVEPN